MATTPTSTMGEYAEIIPEEEEEKESFLAIIRSIRNNYPKNWELWKVVDFTYQNLFGDEISPIVESKLRIGLPTTDIVRAFFPDATGLSERCYRHIRKIMLSWPLGRALIYAPHNIVEKIHAPSYKDFMNVVRELKMEGKLTNRERTSRLLGSVVDGPQQSDNDTPHSNCSEGRGTTSTPPTTYSAKRRNPEPAEPAPPKRAKHSDNDENLMATVLHQQMALFNKLLEVQAEQGKKLEDLQRSTHHKDLNSSFESAPDSTQEGDEEEPSPTIEDRDWREPQSPQTSYDFKPHTTETESRFAKADPILAQQGEQCQRLGCEAWKNIRYAEVQKQFQATPVFAPLKVNNQLAGVTPNWTSVGILEKDDLTLGAVSHGLLQLRQIFEKHLERLPQEVKGIVANEFLNVNAEFKKKSDDLLQYVCGRRAEVIKQRRDTYKVKNKTLQEILHNIPPSETHLFREPELSETIKDLGGINKFFFPFKKTFPRSSRPTQRGDNYRKGNPKKGPTYQATRPHTASYAGGNKKGPSSGEKIDRNRQNKWKGGGGQKRQQ
ncbi:hypothetical protein ABMA28_010602 [Loxostege sticticalis]|uniref:CID domain-containing protein n=1 Tax=Loxostege sticticalis TaxID=481309 RepID=A0ABD0S9C2_LOXSC